MLTNKLTRAHRRRWEAHILRSLAERPNKKSDYVLLRSAQLVGTALLVLVKTELANEIKNIEAATKKTGLKGMAGNSESADALAQIELAEHA